MQAETYVFGKLGSFGNAEYMLLRQFRFPYEYEVRERFLSADHDRCFMWDREHARRCFKEHTGMGEGGFEHWVHAASNEAIMKFLKDVLKADASVTWTGYRILGTVNRSNGYPVWTLQLFAKCPKSKTKVYTGHVAPNVKLPPGYDGNGPVFIAHP